MLTVLLVEEDRALVAADLVHEPLVEVAALVDGVHDEAALALVADHGDRGQILGDLELRALAALALEMDLLERGRCIGRQGLGLLNPASAPWPPAASLGVASG